MNRLKTFFLTLPLCLTAVGSAAHAGEADLAIPDLHKGEFNIGGNVVSAWNLLFGGSFVIIGTLGISLTLCRQINALPAYKSMLNVAAVIFETCKTYLLQQGKFLLMLFALIAAAMSYYFMGLLGQPITMAGLVLLFSIVGMGGSYGVA